MKREQYLTLRKSNKTLHILYQSAKEGGFTKSYESFNQHFILWTIPSLMKQSLMNRVIDTYDKRFNIIITTFKQKIINIQ